MRIMNKKRVSRLRSSVTAKLAACQRDEARAAFTLIELLVVIAIIALLVSILLPSLVKAKELAKVSACSANFRNIGIGVALYASDSDGFVPTNVNYMGNFNHVAYYLGGWMNFGLLYKMGICEDPKSFYCPSFEGASPGIGEDTPAYQMVSSNWKTNPDVSILRIPYTYLIPHKPGILAVQGAKGEVFDGNEGDYKNWNATLGDVGSLPIGSDLLYDMASWTHVTFKKFNVLFGDGHVSFQSSPWLESVYNWPGWWSGGTTMLHYAFEDFNQ